MFAELALVASIDGQPTAEGRDPETEKPLKRCFSGEATELRWTRETDLAVVSVSSSSPFSSLP